MINPWVTQVLVVGSWLLYAGLTIAHALGVAERPDDVVEFNKWCIAAALGIDTMGRIRLALQARRASIEIKERKNNEDLQAGSPP